MLSKNKPLYIFFLYAIVICAVYAQVVFLGRSLVPSLFYPEQFSRFGYEGRIPVNSFNIDLATPAFYEMPVNKLAGDMYLKGQAPLWNPYQAAGTPLAAQYSTRVFFPYQILEDISPFWLWDYFMLGRILIAAFFTYLFLRLLGIGSYASFLGGIFYGFCGSFVWFINLEQFVNVAMMVPILLFTLERLISFKKARYVGESAIAVGGVLLAGQPEIAIYVLFLAASYYLFRILMARRQFLRGIARFLIVISLGLGIAAIVISPFLEYIPNAYQCHPAGGTMGFQDPAGLYTAISIIVPSFFEFPVAYRIFPHNGIWDCLGGFSGIAMLYLIVVGFFYKNKYKDIFFFFAIFGAFIILKNFGFPLAIWIGRLPFLDQSWSPRWAGPVWTFCLACAGAMGLEIISNSGQKKKLAHWIGAFLILAIMGILAYKTGIFPQLKGLDKDALKAVLPPILGGLAVSACVVFILTFLIFYCKNKKALVCGIILTAAFELWFYVPIGINYPWTLMKIAPFFIGAAAVLLSANERWRGAIFGVICAASAYTFIAVNAPSGLPERYNLFKEPAYIEFLKKDIGFYRVVAGDGILMPNFSSAFKIADIRYINSLSCATYQYYADNHLLREAHSAIYDRLWFTGLADTNKAQRRPIYEEINDNLLYYSYLGLKYIITPREILLNLPLVYEGEVNIYENTRYLPRVYIARQIQYAPDYKTAQGLMAKEGFDIKDTVVLEEGAPAWYGFGASSNLASSSSIQEYGPNKIKIDADLKTDGILVFTDVSYPGWKAYADGKETKIYRVNGLVRGVFLKEGSHRVEFRYFPDTFKMGLIITLLSIALCLLFIFYRRSQKPNNQNTDKI